MCKYTDYIVRETTYPLATGQKVVGELVRCKDCKFYVKNNPTVLCLRDSGNPEWFCADGERKG